MNWFPDWSPDTCQIGMRKLRHFANIFMVHLDFNEWNSKKIELNMIYCEIVHQIKGLVLISENKTHFLKNYWARPIFDPFSAPRTTRIAGILFNFDEAVVNLFLELLTTNHQFWQAWCQIIENWSQKSNLVSIQLQSQIWKSFWWLTMWLTCFDFDSVTR